MAKIQVTWSRNKSIDDLTPDLLEKYSAQLRVAYDLHCCEIPDCDNDHWILTFAAPTFEQTLSLSNAVLDDIRYQAHPMSGFGNVKASRRVVASTADEPIKELNIMLTAFDKAQNELKASKWENGEIKQAMAKAAMDIKDTRSDKLSPLVGGKLRNIRMRLERLAA